MDFILELLFGTGEYASGFLGMTLAGIYTAIKGAATAYTMYKSLGNMAKAEEARNQMNSYAQMLTDFKRNQLQQANTLLPEMIENKRAGLRGIQDVRTAYTAKRPSSFGMTRDEFQPMRGIRDPFIMPKLNLPHRYKDEGYQVPDYSNFIPPKGIEGMDDAILQGDYYDEDAPRGEVDEYYQNRGRGTGGRKDPSNNNFYDY